MILSQWRRHHVHAVPSLIVVLAIFMDSLRSCRGFLPIHTTTTSRKIISPQQQHQQSSVCTIPWRLLSHYVPPTRDNTPSDPTEVLRPTTKTPLLPKVGDIVRYYDVDGGKNQGQVLVGKITFIQKQIQPSATATTTTTGSSSSSGWMVELTQLDDTGDGYYAEFPSRQRGSKKTWRDLALISPIAASWVRNENAFKIPRQPHGEEYLGPKKEQLMVRAEQYDINDYDGPNDAVVDQTVVQADNILYQNLKGRLLRYSALVGLGGTVVADLVKGTESAVIYATGVLASLAYLYLLSVKIDTLGNADSRLGKSIANLRFAMPVFVLLGVAFYNKSLGEANPLYGMGTFDYVTPDQFGAAVLGFLTYRLPLFSIQIQDSLQDSGGIDLPGSAGIAMRLAKGENLPAPQAAATSPLTTIFLVSGPQATGRSQLVQRLIREGEGQFVEPTRVDRVLDPATFERIQQREEFLSEDQRYGYTKDGILSSAKGQKEGTVVVIDADVAFARKLTKIAGLRIVGVWVGLSSVEEFERRLVAQVDSGEVPLPEDETKESLVRARIKDIVKEIEYGLSSGIFEFTILNGDEETSLKQLREAGSYCL
jgi:guanylate kinase